MLEVLNQDQTQVEIASKYEVSAANISMWLRHFLENAENIFKGKQILKQHKVEFGKKDEDIDEMHKIIGEVTVSVNWLKNIGNLGFPIRKSWIDTFYH